MGANAKRGSRTQNEIVASKQELPVKNIKHPYSYLTPCYYINVHLTLSRCTCTFTLERGLPVYVLRKILDYSRVTLSYNSVYRESVERY